MEKSFDPAEKLPAALQERLDSWQHSPPRRQFQAYGPLTAYLQGHKFPTSHFLVKPQKLLRKGAYVEDNPDSLADDESDDVGDEGEQENTEQNGAGDQSFDSIDSHGVAVINKNALLPDFTVDRYWGADTDQNPHADVIRVVVEVASLVRLEKIKANYTSIESRWRASAQFRDTVMKQLHLYLTRASSKFDAPILGVALLGNEVALRKFKKGVQHGIEGVGDGWIDFFDTRFVQELNTMRDL